jgi:outer membrane receptor for ferrienterochelin and colicins
MCTSRAVLGVALLGIVLVFPRSASSQEPAARVTVRVLSPGGPLAGAEVQAGRAGSLTDERGEATLRLPSGPHTIDVRAPGYAESSLRVVARAGVDTLVAVALIEEAIELEEILVLSTRTERRIEDEPLRVEVMPREEVEEKLLMTPGDIAMLLNETSGLRIQATAPALGGASVRVQGLPGRFTQILSDGLPLYGAQAGSLGPLQIPPMDLGQVEVIKGVASALYGSSALGGVVNLISRRPAEEPDTELLVNQTSRGGTDALLWSSRSLGARWGYTVLAGAHRQTQADLDGDRWADLPGYRRAELRPRLFLDGGEGRSLLLTVGGMAEDRRGGAVDDARGGAPALVQDLRTARGDVGLLGRLLWAGTRLFTLRASVNGQGHTHRFGVVRERDRHATWFGEGSLAAQSGAHSWVLGAALQREGYRALDVPIFDYTYTTTSLFAQDELSPFSWLTLAASGRLDWTSEFGAFASPRVSALVRPMDDWTVRASVGTGFFAPTPFVEETEAIGLSPLLPVRGLEAERATTGSVDLGGTVGPFEVNATLFGSRVRDVLRLRDAAQGRLELLNSGGVTRTQGTELLARYRSGPLHLTATHTFVRSREPSPDGTGRRDVPLTPRHSAGLVGAWEVEGEGRAGLELYFTGAQELEENPYRTRSEPYLIVGALVERRLGRARVFVNAENLLDVRQTDHDPLLLAAPGRGGRLTTDVWAPLDGRVFNAGVRLQLGTVDREP